MKKENIIELVKLFKKVDYKDLFGALILNEKIDYLQDVEDIQDYDIEYLEELYNKFMNSDNISLINQDLIDEFEEEE